MKLAMGILSVITIIGVMVITVATGANAKKRDHVEVASKEVRRRYKLLARIETFPNEAIKEPQLALTVRSESRDVVYVIETGRYWDFTIEIKDSTGKTVPRKDDQQLLREGGKQSIVPVKAGQEASYAIGLGNLYDLANGKYTLTVKKVIFLSDKQTLVELESAPIEFVVKAS